MAAVGRIELFDPCQETFPRYVKRVRNFSAANDVAAGKHKFVFLNSLGRKHYNLLSNLVTPESPEDKILDELVEVLTTHFQPSTSVIAKQYSFHCRYQDSTESIADFVVGLKKLIACCQYKPAVQSILLRDRFVCGLAHKATRKRLLTEDNP
uniref:Retrotransposon gag domain-containing protein n=1 Tax=Amphimedon queenslandica TaxID=400682 RepID=A0A1X7TQZ6_AMPQE